MLAKIPVLSLVLFSCIWMICVHGHETNAQRMARGLPPLRPRSFGRIVPGRTHFRRKPTPALQAVKRSKPSPSSQSEITYTGRIDVRTTEGQSLGYVRNRADASSISGVSALPGPNQDIIVEIKASRVQNTPTNILVKNAAFAAPYFVGAAGDVNHQSIGAEIRDTLAFTNVDGTTPGSKPVASTNHPGSFVESAIWYINPNTMELSARYVNPDNSMPPTTIAYDIRENSLFFVGDIVAYNTNNSTPASPVRLS
ncbi:hypothetical protein AX15_003104 [Amanita polypyramis BW_CC]|nr:hypothetical protein AX15_003104 [Amanita polypyramis BW_CC]